MEVSGAWSSFLDPVAATIILEAHMHWLVNVTDPMPKELQCIELAGIMCTSISNDLEINLNGRDKAFVSQRAWVIPKLGGRSRQVDKMLPATFAWMIWPDART